MSTDGVGSALKSRTSALWRFSHHLFAFRVRVPLCSELRERVVSFERDQARRVVDVDVPPEV